MRFRSVAAIRQREAVAIGQGLPAAVLMERAGTGLARAIYRLLRARGGSMCLFATGHGNNGGDAFVAARLLEQWGVRCELRLTAAPAALKGAARQAWELHEAAAAPHAVVDMVDRDVLWRESDPAAAVPPDAVVVDALLGTGARGAPDGTIRAAIDWIHCCAPHAAIVAVDLPSGMDGDTGAPLGGASVRADLTVTFDAPKRGFQFPCAWPALGRVETVDIGLPDDGGEPNDEHGACDALTATDLAPLIRRRRRDSHKGDYGHLLVVGGSAGMAGAPALAALGALRAGAGLVSALVPACAAATLATCVPEAMTFTLPERGEAAAGTALPLGRRTLTDFDTLVAGPGLGTDDGARGRIAALLAAAPPRLLLDADALNVLALDRPLRTLGGPGRVILTPHPGEAARLLGTTTAAVQDDRAAAVRRLADATGAVVVLKGCATLVCAPGGRPLMNLTGNPGLASGGSGDVLSGVIGALWGQGLSAPEAAALGVYLHATAADLAAWRGGEAALIARDVAAHLGEAAATLGAGHP